MIILKELRWSNLFSYGENNTLRFDQAPLTQIVGLNGHGKSSIGLILEEVLYSKNSKGIKKADVVNRHAKSKKYFAELDFNKDGDEYTISVTRASTQTVKLTCNGEDISSHTATATYKSIEDIIGYDHKTFCQIIYQSSSASLEFLTATDGNRKKFLIDLLNLGMYTDAAELFKSLAKTVSDEATVAKATVASAESWINKYAGVSLVEQVLDEVPSEPRELIEAVTSVKTKLTDIDKTNKRIAQNNKYKELMDALEVLPASSKPTIDPTLSTVKVESNKAMKDVESFIAKMKKLGALCPTCLQDIDKEKIASIVSSKTQEYEEAEKAYTSAVEILTKYEAELKRWNKEESDRRAYEEYHSLYDPTMQNDLLDKKELEDIIRRNEASILSIQKQIKALNESNSQKASANARITMLTGQLQEMKDELVRSRSILDQLTQKLSTLQVLVKTFSPTGLVAYKIECLIKDLEEETNKYLVEISSGRFQISFQVSADKLNVVITDSGTDIDISALSSGERARVNTAALLGIRRLMQSLSKTRINLLILDETIENLDLEGKERLVEVLLSEEHLNTFVISHGFTHPLLEKVTVVKSNNFSRIE